MREAAAIVISEVDQVIAEARELYQQLREAEHSAAELEQKAATAREAAKMRRLELGQLLARARQAWPQRGPKAKGWGEFLARVGIDDCTAWRYIQEATGKWDYGAKRRRACVFFIQGEITRLIKIGVSHDAEARLADLQIGSPDRLALLATVPGDEASKRDLLHQLAAHHSHGEWFREHEEVFNAMRGAR